MTKFPILRYNEVRFHHPEVEVWLKLPRAYEDGIKIESRGRATNSNGIPIQSGLNEIELSVVFRIKLNRVQRESRTASHDRNGGKNSG